MYPLWFDAEIYEKGKAVVNRLRIALHDDRGTVLVVVVLTLVVLSLVGIAALRTSDTEV